MQEKIMCAQNPIFLSKHEIFSRIPSNESLRQLLLWAEDLMLQLPIFNGETVREMKPFFFKFCCVGVFNAFL